MCRVILVANSDCGGGLANSLRGFVDLIYEKVETITIVCLNGKNETFEKLFSGKADFLYPNHTGPRAIIKKHIKQGRIISAIGCAIHLSIKKIGRWTRAKSFADTMRYYDRIDGHYDVAISWDIPVSYSTVYAISNIQASCKYIWIHNYPEVDIQYGLPSFEKIFDAYDRIFCVSNACKESFKRVFPKLSCKTEVAYNIIPTEKIRRLSNERVFGIENNEKFLIASCGRLSAEKQPLFAINIAKEMMRSGIEDFQWLFIGDGSMSEVMQKQIKAAGLENRVVLLGNQPNPWKYIAKADAFVQMSKYESFCLALAEAQILGIPSVTTNFPSAYEIVEDGVTGYIVENNWMAICDKLELLLTEKNKHSEMKHNLASYELKANGSAKQLLDYINS